MGLDRSSWEDRRSKGGANVSAESHDQNVGTALPGADDVAQEATGGTPVLDLDTPHDLTDDEAAEVGAGATRALAITERTQARFGELVRQAVAPQVGETTKRISELVTNSAYKSILESNALTRTHALSGFAEVLGRSTADRAAFSLASGMRASDSVTSVIGKLMAETEGLGIASNALAATVGESLKGFRAADLGLTASANLVAFAKDFGPKVDVSGIQAALGQSEAVRSIVNRFAGTEIARTRSLATQQLVATSGIADLIGTDKMVASWRQSLLAETARSLIGTMGRGVATTG